jgi:DNA uptake protein ComE-like DNA-binding protein
MPRPPPLSPPNKPLAGINPDAGFILIPVLVTLGLLSLIALTVARATRIDVRAAAYQLRSTEAEALADGVTRLAIRRVVADRAAAVVSRAPGNDKSLPLNGQPVACDIQGASAVITAQDAGGLIDLNTASLSLLVQLLAGLGTPKDDAARLAAAIVDFRDFDDVPLPGGAENAEYKAAGLPFGPKNGPLNTVSELDQVLGMTPALLARLRPMVTVSSASRGVDRSVASPAVQRLELQNEFNVPSNGRAFQLRVGVQTPQAVFVRDVSFELNLRAPSGFTITDWRRGQVSPGDPQPGGGEVNSCLDLARLE